MKKFYTISIIMILAGFGVAVKAASNEPGPSKFEKDLERHLRHVKGTCMLCGEPYKNGEERELHILGRHYDYEANDTNRKAAPKPGLSKFAIPMLAAKPFEPKRPKLSDFDIAPIFASSKIGSERAPIQRYICPACPEHYPNKEFLFNHIMSNHCVCPDSDCFKVLSDEAALGEHNLSCHDADAESSSAMVDESSPSMKAGHSEKPQEKVKIAPSLSMTMQVPVSAPQAMPPAPRVIPPAPRAVPVTELFAVHEPSSQSSSSSSSSHSQLYAGHKHERDDAAPAPSAAKKMRLHKSPSPMEDDATMKDDETFSSEKEDESYEPRSSILAGTKAYKIAQSVPLSRRGNVIGHKCPECNTFIKGKDTSSIARHMIIHTQELPYRCLICGFKCARERDLKLKRHVCNQ